MAGKFVKPSGKKTFRGRRIARVSTGSNKIPHESNSIEPINPAARRSQSLKQDKSTELQQETGAELTNKNRLQEKPNATGTPETLPTYGNYIKNRRLYNKYARKVKHYAKPYTSSYEAEPEQPAQANVTTTQDNDPTEESSYIVPNEVEPVKADQHNNIQENNLPKQSAITDNKTKQANELASPKQRKLKIRRPKKPFLTASNVETEPASKFNPKSKSKLTDTPQDTQPTKTQKDINQKKQHHEQRLINTSKSPKSIAAQHKLYDKTDKLLANESKLREKRLATIEKMPIKQVTTKERIYNAESGKVATVSTKDKRTLHQSEARWNNPTIMQKLKSADGAKEKTKVVATTIGKKGAVLGVASTAGVVAGVGTAPAVASVAVAKPTLKYGSKLLTNSAHRQVRKDIRQNGDNEVLKATHWAEQKGERAVVQVARKLTPATVHRYIKNAPYRRESKLQKKELKNDRNLGLLRVKQDKLIGTNHLTGKKTNALTRAWQKRQIKKNYQKAMQAAKGKVGGGTFSAMTRELARGNPKAILTLLAKKVAVVALKFVAKITVFNPIFWKMMLLVLIFLVILGAIQSCVALFTPGLAGFGFVSDEDISFSTRIYSEWEVDMKLFLNETNIQSQFPPPDHITNQPIVSGIVVYPEPPYTPPPPFYEYRFEIGMIRHDPVELISYLTARHGERFDDESDNPMTRNDLQAILQEIFAEQYGISPGDFSNLIHEEIETRFRRERQTTTEERYDDDGNLYPHEEVKYVDIYYEFWILTVRLESRSLSDVLRNRMTEDEDLHFDVLNLTNNGRQVVGNPFNFNWLPNITSHYGYRINPTGSGKQFHRGIDIAAPLGTQLFATHTGTIATVQFSDTGYGNMLRLRGYGSDEVIYETLFAHLHEIFVTNGQAVEQGDLIATVGSSGDSTGPHLHLEVYRPAQQISIDGATTNLTAMHLNPIFAVITWTDEQSNADFRPAPGESGTQGPSPPHIPDIPPDAMSDERFMAILTEASRHLGARYVWGGAGPTTFDCSGFIHWVFSNAGIGWTHGRTTSQGYFNLSTPVTAENARPGDLVFFHGTHSGAFITHVGIYIGNGQMIHTGGNPAGVEFVSLNNPFWQRHFYSFGRV